MLFAAARARGARTRRRGAGKAATGDALGLPPARRPTLAALAPADVDGALLADVWAAAHLCGTLASAMAA